jgi:hypothetical protein
VIARHIGGEWLKQWRPVPLTMIVGSIWLGASLALNLRSVRGSLDWIALITVTSSARSAY